MIYSQWISSLRTVSQITQCPRIPLAAPLSKPNKGSRKEISEKESNVGLKNSSQTNKKQKWNMCKSLTMH